MRGALGVYIPDSLFSGNSARQWPLSLWSAATFPWTWFITWKCRVARQRQPASPHLVSSTYWQLHSTLQNQQVVIPNINSVLLSKGFYYLSHMSLVFAQIELEQLKRRRRKEERKKERRERKEKNLQAGVGATSNTQNLVHQHHISFYCLETLFQDSQSQSLLRLPCMAS